MNSKGRIKIGKYEFATLIEEVNGLCPLCAEKLITMDGSNQSALSQAAHIYPHSPTDKELEILAGVPKLSDDPENVDNLIMLCPNCHYKFDHPRTREGYLQIYKLKSQLIKRQKARSLYSSCVLEDDLVKVLDSIGLVDSVNDNRKLQYKAMTVTFKMETHASKAIENIVIRDVRDYFIPIEDALMQLEHDTPGKSDLIAKEIALFYSQLKLKNLSYDSIYYAINEWLDIKTNGQYTLLTPLITAFYVQDCEVFS